MSVLAALPLALAALVGWLLCRRLLPHRGGLAAGLLSWSVGIGVGLALMSVSTFAWLLVVGRLGRGLILFELLAVGAAILLGRGAPPRIVAAPRSWSKPEIVTAAVVLGSIALAVTIFAVQSLSEPHGFWDAWAIWNQRARFLLRAGADWRRAFSPELLWAHPDYPLLLPSLIARGWTYAGSETKWVPVLVGATFTFASAGLLGGLLTWLKGSERGWIAAGILLATPIFALQGTYQCADVPLGFYFLGAVGCLALEDVHPEGARRLALLSGLLAGCAAWTKNEGALLVVSLLLVRTAGGSLRSAPEARARLGCFVLGALPAVVLLAGFRLTLATQTDLISEQSWAHIVATSLDPVRYGTVLAALGRLAVRDYSPALGAAFLSVLVVGTMPSGGAVRRVARPALVLSLVAVGYFLVYVTTPQPFEWHIATSLSRVTLQLWPSFLFCVFLLPDSRSAPYS